MKNERHPLPKKKNLKFERRLAFVERKRRTVVRFSEDNNLFGMAKSTLEDR